MITKQAQNHHLGQFIKLRNETHVLSLIKYRKKRRTKLGTYLILLVKLQALS
jgi:ribosomal protein L39E